MDPTFSFFAFGMVSAGCQQVTWRVPMQTAPQTGATVWQRCRVIPSNKALLAAWARVTGLLDTYLHIHCLHE